MQFSISDYPAVPLLDPSERRLAPEILDSLPYDHPTAQAARRGLYITNQLLGNYHWLTRTLTSLADPNDRILELGAGGGEFGTRLAQRGFAVDGLDLWPRPNGWPRDRTWHEADLRDFAGINHYQLVFGNLLFHHLTNEALRAFGQRLQSVRVIVASDLARRRMSQVFFRNVAPLFADNAVTVYDGLVSIAAGFRDDELPAALGLDPRRWEWRCRTSMFGMYRMVAIRRDAGDRRTKVIP